VDEDNPWNLSEKVFMKHQPIADAKKKWSVHHPFPTVAYFVHESEMAEK
jgi:hypothetical protein